MSKFLSTLKSDPLTAISGAVDAVMSFATQALPPTELRLARFKLLFPTRYRKVKEKMLRAHYRWLKQHKAATPEAIEAYVKLVSNSPEDRLYIINLLRDEQKKYTVK